MKLSRKLVIKHHSPLYVIAVAVVTSVAIAMTTWAFLDESQWSYIMSNLSEAKKSKELWQENQRVKNAIVKLEEQIIMLERTAQIEKQTITRLQKDIIEHQDEIYKLRNELEFYQGIMTSAGDSKGLNIQGLHIEETSQPRSYYFKLILTHVSKSDKVAAGTLSILLEGIQGGVGRTVDVRDLTLSESLSLNFKFDSFERIEGSIMLPEGFDAHRVIVRARQKSRKKVPEIERIFDWSEAVNH